MKPPAPFEIRTPELFNHDGTAHDMAIQLSLLRTHLFQNELRDAGVPEHAVAEHTADWSSDFEVFADALQVKVDHGDAFIKAVILGRKVVGYFSGRIEQTPDGYEHKELAVIQLAPEARRRKLGRELIDQFAKFSPLPDQDDTRLPIELDVLENNVSARKFYQAEGFVEKPAAYPEPFDIAGTKAPLKRMIKMFD